MRLSRIAVVLGLALLDGLAAVYVGRLGYAWWLSPPRDLWRVAGHFLRTPVEPIDVAAFAAGALCAPLLLCALDSTRLVGVRFAARAALLGSLYGFVTAMMTGVLVPVTLARDWRSPLVVLGAIVYGSAIGAPTGLGVAFIFAPVIVLAGGLLGLLNGGVLRLGWRAPR